MRLRISRPVSTALLALCVLIGCGGSSPPASGGEFLYVPDAASNNISAYSINVGTGALTPVPGSPFAADTQPGAAVVTPAGKYLFVGNAVSNNVSAYAINSSSGALTAVGGSPFAGPANISSVATASSGQFLYVAGRFSGSISAYSINSSSGALALISGSPFAAGAYAQSISVDPSGKFLYVTDNGFLRIYGFAINPTTGVLTPVAGSPFAVPPGVNPIAAAIDPLNRFLYVIDAANNLPTAPFNQILVYGINTTSGVLTAVTGSPFSSGTNEALAGVAAEPSGKFVYVTNYASVLSFAVNAAGTFTPGMGSPFNSSFSQVNAAVDPSGKYLYVINPYSASSISAYTINGTTGSLTPLPGSPFAAGNASSGIAIALTH